MTQALSQKALALKAVYRSVNKIDVHDIRQMYGIYCQYYENTSWDIFLRDLSKKNGRIFVDLPQRTACCGVFYHYDHRYDGSGQTVTWCV